MEAFVNSYKFFVTELESSGLPNYQIDFKFSRDERCSKRLANIEQNCYEILGAQLAAFDATLKKLLDENKELLNTLLEKYRNLLDMYNRTKSKLDIHTMNLYLNLILKDPIAGKIAKNTIHKVYGSRTIGKEFSVSQRSSPITKLFGQFKTSPDRRKSKSLSRYLPFGKRLQQQTAGGNLFF
jgi:hypothetical protein